MSAILTRELVIQTMPLIRPIFNDLVASGRTQRADGTKRKDFHFVVLDPTVMPFEIAVDDDFHAFQEEVVLYQESFTPPETWGDIPFKRIALAKAYITWRTGHSSRYIQQMAPHMLTAVCTKHGGSAIVDGIITAGSGVQGFWDGAYAQAAGAILSGAAHQVMQERIMPSDADFIGEVTF